jgi:hypothetical protein
MIQEYDFDIEHVAGEENIVADAFSRLMAMPKENLKELSIRMEYDLLYSTFN